MQTVVVDDVWVVVDDDVWVVDVAQMFTAGQIDWRRQRERNMN